MGKNVTSFPDLNPRYEIQELLGEGGMSFIYKAWDRILQKWIVLKYASPDIPELSAFLREYEILYSLHHPHLPSAYDLYASKNKLFFTMDWVEGRNLAEDIRSGQHVTPSLFYSVFFQLLSALQYCHNHRIVHYDLKPENLIIHNHAPATPPSITLIDFGLSQMEDEPRSTAIQGTIQYSSPEMIKKEKTDHRSDLYAMGVILYEMATGNNPFDDPNVVNVVVNHLEKKINSLETDYAFITEDIKKIILKLLEKDPDYRYQNVEEIYRDLKPLHAQFHPVELEDQVVLHSCFVNRDNVLTRLTEATSDFFSDLHHEKASVLWITGEEGVGKSSLLKRFKLNLEKDGHTVISMRVAPSHHQDHVRMFLRRVFYLSNTPKPADEFIHEWEWVQDTSNRNDVIDRENLFTGLSDLVLNSVVNVSGLCVLIDDADLLNEFENDFFSHLFRKLNYSSPFKVVFYMTALSHEVSFLHLENFDLSETTLFIKTLLNDTSLNDEVATMLYDATRGNPFLIHNTLVDLIQSESFVKSGQEWQLLTNKIDSIPSSIHEFVITKIKGLSPEDKLVLENASVFPTAFTFRELQVLIPNYNLWPSLHRLLTGGLIDGTAGNYVLGSQYLRDHVYKSIPQDMVNQRHLELTKHYELSGDKKFIAPLAYHYFNSSEKNKALPYLLELADIQKKAFLPKEALESLRQASSLLRDMDQHDQLIDTLFKLEELHDQLGQRKDQEKIIDDIIKIAERHDHKQGMIRGFLRKANYLERISKFVESQKTCENAIRISKEKAGGFLLGQLYRQLGRNYYNQALWKDALEHYREAYDLAMNSKDQKLEMECLNSLGTAYGSMNDYENAKEYFIKSFKIAETTQDLERKINAVFNIARIYYKMNELDKSLEYLELSFPWAKSAKNRKLEQLVYQLTALIYLDMHLYESTFLYNEKVHALSIDLDDRSAMGRVLANQAVLYMRIGFLKQSESLIQQAIECAIQLNNKKDLFNRRLYYVELLLHMKNYDHCSQWTRECLDYFSKNNEDDLSFLSKLILLKTGVETRFVAITFFDIEKLVGHLDELVVKNYSGITNSVIILAFYLASKAFRISGNLAKAISYSNEAVFRLDKEKYYEFSAAEVYYNHYETILGSNTPRNIIGNYLEKAFKKIRDIESQLKRSDFKTGFMNIPLHQEIINEYKHFFSEEREFDIQSFQILYEITQNINSILDSDKLFDRIMDSAIDNTKSDRGLILIKSETSDQFDIKVARNIDQETLSDMTHISQSIVQEVYQTGQSIVTADANLDDRFKSRKSIVAYNIRSIMCVPLKIKNSIIGAVYVDKQFDTHYFSPRNLKFLESFANIAGVAIENARLYEKLNLEKDYLSKENIELKSEIREKFLKYNIVGNSKMMKQVFHLIENAADNSANVLIQGESGTGKELVAKAIHYNGNRKNKKFVAVDCGALPENLLESELFGYKKGAFTGATTDKKGLFEEADGGTIFLDEITNTSLNFQSRLLRVIQEGEIRRVGDNETRKINVRSIVATNRNLSDQVKAGLFREDLYYRLNVIPISLPPLRERKEDIPLLVQYFIDKHNKANNKNISSVSNELMERLMEHRWRGNIRELENILNRMIIFSTNDKLTFENLPDEIKKSELLITPRGAKQISTPSGLSQKTLDDFESELSRFEKEYFSAVLEKAGGNKSKAAELLGIKRTTLNDRLKKLGL